MEKNGYITQNEIPDGSGTDLSNEISVNIGRDGELIFNNSGGHNRLSTAKILGVDEILVKVTVDIINGGRSETNTEKQNR